MKILKRKKVKLNFVMAAFASCFCMLLVTRIIGEQFGFVSSVCWKQDLTLQKSRKPWCWQRLTVIICR